MHKGQPKLLRSISKGSQSIFELIDIALEARKLLKLSSVLCTVDIWISRIEAQEKRWNESATLGDYLA
jgi:hypothetical protein